ncbi:hypothetical protein Hanom_Chr15g01365871 [Helianthus anomalus]
MFDPTFERKVELLPCGERECFNLEIVGNFRVPDRATLKAPLPQGKGINEDFFVSCKVYHCNLLACLYAGDLGNLGKFEVKVVPKKHVEKKHAEKPARGRGGGAAVGGTAAGSTLDGGKRKPEQTAAGAGEMKRRKLQSRRAAPTKRSMRSLLVSV